MNKKDLNELSIENIVFDYGCEGKEKGRLDSVNLYIEVSGVCGNGCRFCDQVGVKKSDRFDVVEFERVYKEIEKRGMINRISLTGGEPLLRVDNVDEVLRVIKCGRKYHDGRFRRELHVSMNTSGIELEKRIGLIKNVDILDDVHISRHYYEDDVNEEIFRNKNVCGKEKIREINERGIYSLSCNLIGGYVDSVEKVKMYLDDGIRMGVKFVGFVGLMKKNEYCESRFVDMDELTTKLKFCEGFLYRGRKKKCSGGCKCENYLYMNEEGECEIYFRQPTWEENRVEEKGVRGFVYTNDNKLVVNYGKGKREEVKI